MTKSFVTNTFEKGTLSPLSRMDDPLSSQLNGLLPQIIGKEKQQPL